MHINLRATLYFLEVSRDPSSNIKNSASNLALSALPDIRQFWDTTALFVIAYNYQSLGLFLLFTKYLLSIYPPHSSDFEKKGPR